MAYFEASTDIDVPIARVWDALLDWEGTERWMVPPTTVRVLGEQRTGIGTRIEAVTTVARIFKIVDHFVVTNWIEEREIRVRHTGWLVRGDGIFRLEPVADKTRFTWIEDMPFPLGVVSEIVAVLVRPLIQRYLRRSTERLGRDASRH